MERKPIEDATADEVRRFASISMGLDVNKHMTRDQVQNMLRQAGYTGDTIVVHAAEPGIPATPEHMRPGQVPPTSLHYNEDEMVPVLGDDGKPTGEKAPRVYVCILIPSVEGKSGQRAVPVSTNGKTMLIPRDTACWVPREYYRALDLARVQVYAGGDYVNGEGGGLEEKPREVHSYPFQYASAPFKGIGKVDAA